MIQIGHGLLVFTGALMIYDVLRCKIRKKQIQQKKAKQKTTSIKLCLTGGPCGGKSSGINCIYNTFKQISAPFLIVPQAATIIGSAGLTLDLSNFTPSQIQSFQIYLMRLQYNLQSIIQDVANTLAELGKSVVILCDRGLLDGKAYAGDQNWKRMLERINITEEQINDRYQAVFHMETAARGAAESYFYIPSQTEMNQKSQEQVQVQGNKVRRQSPQTAIQLDQKIQKCYMNHPMRFVIRNHFFVKDFNMKTILLVAQVNQMLEFILRKINIQNYFSDYKRINNTSRKISQDDLQYDVSPYLIRKRKYKKWKRQRTRSVSPKRERLTSFSKLKSLMTE